MGTRQTRGCAVTQGATLLPALADIWTLLMIQKDEWKTKSQNVRGGMKNWFEALSFNEII